MRAFQRSSLSLNNPDMVLAEKAWEDPNPSLCAGDRQGKQTSTAGYHGVPGGKAVRKIARKKQRSSVPNCPPLGTGKTSLQKLFIHSVEHQATYSQTVLLIGALSTQSSSWVVFLCRTQPDSWWGCVFRVCVSGYLTSVRGSAREGRPASGVRRERVSGENVYCWVRTGKAL